MSNPYHDEKGRFASGGSSNGRGNNKPDHLLKLRVKEADDRYRKKVALATGGANRQVINASIRSSKNPFRK